MVPLLPLFHFLNTEYFDNSLSKESKPLVTVRWSDGRLRKTAGFYRRQLDIRGSRKSEIVLSKPLLRHLPEVAIKSTLCHEMIHAWVDLVLGLREGHGPNFRGRMAVINSLQNEFEISIYHKFPVPVTSPRWLATCPKCGIRYSYKRRVIGAACKKCCNDHFGGRWDSRCLLDYKSVVTKN